jgi:hypothetical protein
MCWLATLGSRSRTVLQLASACARGNGADAGVEGAPSLLVVFGQCLEEFVVFFAALYRWLARFARRHGGVRASITRQTGADGGATGKVRVKAPRSSSLFRRALVATMNTRMPFHCRAGRAHGHMSRDTSRAFPLLLPSFLPLRLTVAPCWQLTASYIDHLPGTPAIHIHPILILTPQPPLTMLSLPLAKLSSTQDAHPDDPKLTWKHESHDLHFVIDSYQAGGSARQLLKVVQGTQVRVRVAAAHHHHVSPTLH